MEGRGSEIYQYTADLLYLDFCHVAGQQAHPLLREVHTSLIALSWETALKDHPDRAFVHSILRGLTHGF